MRGWLARPVLAVLGAAGGAGFIALLEGVKASREWHSPVAETVLGDAAVLMPLATATGLVVSVAMMTIDPDRRWTPAAVLARLRIMSRGARARLGAVALLAPPAIVMWLLASAHAARAVLLRDADPWAAGAAMGATSAPRRPRRAR